MSDQTLSNISRVRQRGFHPPATRPAKGTVTQARFDSVAHGNHLKYDYGCRCDDCYDAYLLNLRIDKSVKTACAKWMRENKPALYRHIVQDVTNKKTGPKITKGSRVAPVDASLRDSVGVGNVTKTRPATNEIYVEWSESPLNLAGWLPITQVAPVEA